MSKLMAIAAVAMVMAVTSSADASRRWGTRPTEEQQAREAEVFRKTIERSKRGVGADAARLDGYITKIMNSMRFKPGIRGGLGCTTPWWVGRSRAMSAAKGFARDFAAARANGTLEQFLRTSALANLRR